MSINASVLFAVESAASLFRKGIEIATAVGLPTTSWRTGDPTRTLFRWLSERLSELDVIASSLVKSAFLTSASGDWLTILAEEVYGVPRDQATYASIVVTLNSTGGYFYDFDPGDITVSVALTGKTYRSVTGGTLSAGGTLDLDFVADEAGSDSSVSADEIDTIVTTFLGVEVGGNTAGVGIDQESDDSLKERCRDTLGALSPSGPADAYEAVARNSALTGVSDITRAVTDADHADGTVTVYISGPSGVLPPTSIDAAQAAVDQWATPLGFTATVANSSSVVVNLEAQITGVDIPGDAQDVIEDLFAALLAQVNGGDTIAVSALSSMIHNWLVSQGVGGPGVVIVNPSEALELDISEVPVPGVTTITEV